MKIEPTDGLARAALVEHDQSAFNLARAVRLRGRIAVEDVQRAARAVLSALPPSPYQPAADAAPRVRTIRSRQDAIEEEVVRAFTLDEVPLARALILIHDSTDITLIVTAHHLLLDGGALDRVVVEILRSAFGVPGEGDGRTVEPPLVLPAADLDDLRSRLAAVAEQALPWRRVRTAAPTAHAHLLHSTLEVAIHSRVAAYGRTRGMTTAQVLTALFAAAVHRWADASDVAFTVPVNLSAARDYARHVTPVVVASHLGDEGLSAFAEATRERLLAAMRYRALSLPEIARAAALPWRPDGTLCLTDVEFTVVPPFEVPPLGVSCEPLPMPVPRTQRDIALEATPAPGGPIALTWRLRTDVFDPEDVRAIDTALRQLCACLEEPDRPLGALSILDGPQAAIVYRASRGPIRTIDQRSVLERIAMQPVNATAVIDDRETLSYRELIARAEQVAAELQRLGVQCGDRVVLSLQRGADAVAAMLGTWAAGAVYVPVDPANPERRLQLISDQVHPVAVLRGLENLREHQHERVLSGARRRDPDEAAYIIFTSGSTGRPKGALIGEHGLLNHLDGMQSILGLGSADTLAQTAPIGFDVHVWQMIAPLVVGGTVRIYTGDALLDPVALARRFEADGVTIAEFVPPFLDAWLQLAAGAGAAAPRSLRVLISTGEAMPSALGSRLRAYLGESVRVLNAYGPAEASDDVALYEFGNGPATGVVPLGIPVQNCRLTVLDRWGSPRPPGMIGELAVSGASVGLGYVEPPPREVFGSDPDTGERRYLTGDLGWFDPAERQFHFAGRIDHQVKVGGRRVELGEVENAILAETGAGPAIAGVVDRAGVTTLVAAVQSDRPVDPAGLRDRLRLRLPAYMVPAEILTVSALPLSANGKIRRTAAIAGLFGNADATDVADEVTGCWRSALGSVVLTATSNFFALGGDSLRAVAVTAALRDAGYDVSVRDLYEHQTLGAYDRELRGRRRSAVDERLPDATTLPGADLAGLSDSEVEQLRRELEP